MPREDNVELPPHFLQLATARSMGALITAMQGGSRLQAMRDKELAIGLFEGGGVVGTFADPQPFHFRYDEVERFTQHVVAKYVNGSYRRTDITCFLTLTDGRSHRVSGSSTPSTRNIVDDFRQIVDPRVAAAQLPRMRAALQQGRTLDFGDFTADPGGLCRPSGFLRKEKRLAWSEVKEVAVKSGFVKVMARGKRSAWASTSVESVPNLTAFATLVHAAANG